MLKVDTVAPGGPTGVHGGNGSSSVKVGWTVASDASIREYEVHAAQVSSCDEDTAGSKGVGLEAGDAPPASSAAVVTAEKGSSSASVNPNSIGLDFEPGSNSAEVSVVAVDQAGNRSTMHSVSCIERVRTTGFCGEQERLGGQCEDWSCSAAAPGRPRSSPVRLRWPQCSCLSEFPGVDGARGSMMSQAQQAAESSRWRSHARSLGWSRGARADY